MPEGSHSVGRPGALRARNNFRQEGAVRVRYRYDTHNTADDEKRGFSHGDRGGYQERDLDARMSLRDRCKYYTLVAR